MTEITAEGEEVVHEMGSSGKDPEENRRKNVLGPELGSAECLSREQPGRSDLTREGGRLGHGGLLARGERAAFFFCAQWGAMEGSGKGDD